MAKYNFWTTSIKYLPIGEETSSAMPYFITHHLSEKYADRKDVKIRISRQIESSQVADVYKTIKKCTFHMLHNCSQMNHVENSEWRK